MSRTAFLVYNIYTSVIQRGRIVSKRREQPGARPVRPSTGIWLQALFSVYTYAIRETKEKKGCPREQNKNCD